MGLIANVEKRKKIEAKLAKNVKKELSDYFVEG